MRLNPNTGPRTFKLLGIGHRGVGKTVFLAGSYTELDASRKKSHSQDVWFECQDNSTKRNMGKLLGYIAKTGQYPPATMKVTNFIFSAKARGVWGNKTLCNFHWWDIPGEFCNKNDPAFQAMLLHSQGCCLLLDGNALAQDPDYLQKHMAIIKQVEAIASLTNQNGLKYPFALVITKCDLLEAGPLKLLRIEEHLQPLLASLEKVNAIYRRFYSGIPIELIEESHKISPKGASIPFRWLISEFSKLNIAQAQQSLGSGIQQTLYRPPDKTAVGAAPILNWAGNNKLVVSLASVGLLGLLAALLFNFSPLIANKGAQNTTLEQAETSEQQLQILQDTLKQDPDNLDALRKLVALHTDLGQFNQAIPLMEQLVQQQPTNLDFRFELAGLYALTTQKEKEEAVYDQILKQHNSNLIALTSKARLRIDNNDIPSAKQLFEQAEKTAPTKALKAEVQKIANEALGSASTSE